MSLNNLVTQLWLLNLFLTKLRKKLLIKSKNDVFKWLISHLINAGFFLKNDMFCNHVCRNKCQNLKRAPPRKFWNDRHSYDFEMALHIRECWNLLNLMIVKNRRRKATILFQQINLYQIYNLGAFFFAFTDLAMCTWITAWHNGMFSQD